MTADQMKRELSGEFENDLIALGAAGSITFNMGVGIDTSEIRYLNSPSGVSYGFELLPTVACSITKLNGKVLKSPISVGTGGIRMTTGKYTSVTIQAGSATVLELLAKW